MASRILVAVSLGMGIFGTYTLGARDAQADAYACYQMSNFHLGCQNCVSIACPPCEDGTCPGSGKFCQSTFDLTIEPSGYLNATPIWQACFFLLDCSPENEGSCSAQNPCTARGNPEFSTSYFGTHRLSGDCPPTP